MFNKNNIKQNTSTLQSQVSHVWTTEGEVTNIKEAAIREVSFSFKKKKNGKKKKMDKQ